MLDLRVGRLVQIVNVIREVTKQEIRMRREEIEWSTRALATFIANTVQDDKARDQMFSSATNLSMTGASRSEGSADTPGERSLEDIMEHGDIDGALARNEKRSTPMPFVDQVAP